ncbi:DUF6978 family protein [Achromobacter xylosoxidans]|uniref:DUF6978 family protein n=1 Tax=Alcaligenes xylosoxydans xylosoxydans TaxID=85698 RepID=UPI002A748F2D|nr:hypothetical protein [Achromobacter xylosoxidans]WPQ37779.1 hypothetical protein SLH34_13280 [Achromobacter xylosoxidans]
MAKDNLSDEEIDQLLSMPKVVTNPRARMKTLERQEQWDYNVESTTTEDKFALFVRQSTRLSASFSVGLRHLKGEDSVTLMRCNGPSHPHRNHLEDERFGPHCHVHMATSRYLSVGKKDEGYAYITDAYTDVKGALGHLLSTCNVAGLTVAKETGTPPISSNQLDFFRQDE